MLWQPSGGIVQLQNNLAATPSTATPASTITGSGTANTKGSWVELIASTTYDVYMIQLIISTTNVSATQTDTLLDIGIGAAASEQTIIPNLLAGWKGPADTSPMILQIPIYIPKGQRIAARAQSVIVSKTVKVSIFCFGGKRFLDCPVYTMCDAYGITSSGASNGTSITPGNTGTEGSWTSVGGTLSRDYRGILFLVQGTLTDTAMDGNAYHWEIGYNSGAPMLGEYWSNNSSAERVVGPFPNCPIAAFLASGTQMQVRGECGGTAKPMDVGLYCFY